MKTLSAVALVGVTAVLGCGTFPVAATVAVQPGKQVTAEASKFSPLWLSPLPIETSSELLDDLLAQCGGTGLTGVTITTSIAWAVIGQVEKMNASAYCVEPSLAGPVDEMSLPPDMKMEWSLVGLGGLALRAP
jgi:hypothetical protein